MNSPSLRTYLFGNPLSLVGAWGLFASAAYRCATGEINPVMPILLLMLAGYASKAAGQILKYRRWKRDWNEMQGAPKRAGSGSRSRSDSGSGVSFNLARIPGVRPVLALIIWGVVAIYLRRHSDDPALALPVLLFWPMTVVIVLVVLYRSVRHLLRRGGRASDRAVMVTVCATRALDSPSVAQAFASLPDYCAELLAPPGAERVAAPQTQRRS